MSDPLPPLSELLSTQSAVSVYRSHAPVPYLDALAWMQTRVDAIAKGQAPQALWFLEHPPLYTAGTSAKTQDLIQPDRFEVFQTGRGGEYTYHGPGQRVVYVLLDLNQRQRDVRAFVKNLEGWIIEALATLGTPAGIRDGRIGVWVETGPNALGQSGEAKIAAIGIRVRRWITFHGIAINVCPNLDHFLGIVPCGIADFGVTSLAALGHNHSMADVDDALLTSANKFLDV